MMITLVFLISSSAIYADASKVVDINAYADSYVVGSSPRQNYGKERLLKSDGVSEKISYIRFNLRELRGHDVMMATLKLYVNNPSKDHSSIYITHENGWSENNITFDNRPRLFDNPIIALIPNLSRTWYEFDITKIIQEQKGKSITIAITSKGLDSLSLSSKEAKIGQPMITVDAKQRSLAESIADVQMRIADIKNDRVAIQESIDEDFKHN